MQTRSVFRSWRGALALAAASLFVQPAEARGTPFDGCGTIVMGVTCPRMFQADAGGTWVLSTYGSFVVGDRVRVVGNLDPSCITICQQGGCIFNNTIGPCDVCACTAFCAGDGTATACPCGNGGGAGRGCANSVNPSGALLAASGNSALSNDTVVLAGSGMPDAPALYFQGSSQQNGGLGALFGDGLRCAGGTVVRLGPKVNSGGASQYPGAGDASVSVRGMIGAPGTRTYQVWYRNAADFCTAATFNLSNGVEIAWGA